jgi:NhaP-type Na+/H+ or K+/H+ antiporter
MFALGLSGYFVSEIIHIGGNPMSGVMTLLTAAIINSHYTWYNLSPQGKSTSTVTIGFMGTFAEAAVYSYVGIALYSMIPTWWSFEFIGLFFGIIVVFRIIAIFGVFYTGRLCCRRKTINCRELSFITYAGMIRGAIAFALVLEIPYCGSYDSTTCPCVEELSCMEKRTYELFVSSTLALVILTTLCFGTFMGAVQKLLCPPTLQDKEDVEDIKRALSTITEV